MIYRISELDNEQVDYLRFDRIKIQRKRMEHILEVIKDLSFKNKQLMKDKALLQQDYDQARKYKLLYEQLTVERKVLIEKNIIASSEIQRFKQITEHQEILINSLKEQIYGINQESPNRKKQFIYDIWNQQNEQSKYLEDYIVLKAQYQYLQKQYKSLYKTHYQEENHKKLSQSKKQLHKLFILQRNEDQDFMNRTSNKQNSNTKVGRIYSSTEKPDNQKTKTQIQKFDRTLEQTLNYAKLREKYDKMKKLKRQLVKLIKDLQGELDEHKDRESRNLTIIQLFKQKKGKVCQCHIKKLEKKMTQKALQNQT